MTRFVVGDDRSQSTLFPERLDDYLSEDNPVRAIDVFVDELDLGGLGFDGVEPEATGRPAYHPATMLKIYVYGYLNRVHSSRRLERECQRNIELVWLTGRLMPDFKTIADFRKDNGEAIRRVCREFVVLCRRLELFSEASVAIDGSKFKAVNTRDRNFTQAKMQRRLAQIDESIARYLSQLDSADRQGEAVPEAKITRLKEKIATLRQEIQRLNGLNTLMMQTEDKQISLTDPDARSMATSGHRTRIGISQRYLLVLGLHHQSVQTVQALYFLTQRRNLLFEPGDLGLRHRFPLAISAVQLREVAGNALVNLRQPPLHLSLSEVPVPRVDGFKLAAVDRNARFAEQLKTSAQHHELTADLADGFAIVLAEVGYGLEVRHQAAGQPNQLDVALTLPLQAPARLHPIEVSVDVNLQQRRWMVGWPSCRLRLDAAKAEPRQIKLIDKDIDRPDRIILGQIVFQSLWKQRALTAVFANDKARHRILRPNR